MEKMRVMVVGLPGEIATLVAKHVEKADDMKLVPFTLSEGAGRLMVGETEIFQITPEWHERRLKEIVPDISADFSPLKIAFRNAKLYCKYGVPFVIRISFGDMGILEEMVENSSISAVFCKGTPEVIIKAIRFLWDRRNLKSKIFGM